MTRLKGILEFERFRIPYRVYGEGRDIVCLNGAQQSMAMWSSFLKRFEDKFRITLFDFPHQGKGSVLSGSSQVSVDEQADILRAVIRELGIRQAYVCSASWGGVVALQFAVRYPEYVARLVLASIGMKPNERMKQTIVSGIGMPTQDREEMAHVLLRSFGDDLPSICKNQIVAQFKNMAPERIQAFAEHGMSVIFADSLGKVVPLSQVLVPVTILYGEKDRIIDIADVEDLVKVLPRGRLRRIPGIGHFLHLEDEKVFDIYEEILCSSEPEIFEKSRNVSVAY